MQPIEWKWAGHEMQMKLVRIKRTDGLMLLINSQGAPLSTTLVMTQEAADTLADHIRVLVHNPEIENE